MVAIPVPQEMDASRVRNPPSAACTAMAATSWFLTRASEECVDVVAGFCELAAVEADQLPGGAVVAARPSGGASEAVADLDVFGVEAVVIAAAGAVAGGREIGNRVMGSGPGRTSEGHDILQHLEGAGVPHGGIRAVVRFCQMTLPDGTLAAYHLVGGFSRDDARSSSGREMRNLGREIVDVMPDGLGDRTGSSPSPHGEHDMQGIRQGAGHGVGRDLDRGSGSTGCAALGRD